MNGTEKMKKENKRSLNPLQCWHLLQQRWTNARPLMQCAALKEKFSFASPAKGYAVRTTVTGEGPCTLVATVAYLGMTVIFR